MSMSLVSERSYYEEMKKYTLRGSFLLLSQKNNRLVVYKW